MTLHVDLDEEVITVVIQLRDYQAEAVAAVTRDVAAGVSRPLVVIPTGGGKTEVGLEIVYAALARGERVLWIAHRQELIDQPYERMVRHHPYLAPCLGKVIEGRVTNPSAALVIGSIQSLQNPARLAALTASGHFSMLVVDEAHHVVARTYLRLIDWLSVRCAGFTVLGLTATPNRTDKDGLVKVFSKVSYKITIKELIQRGYLCDFDALGVETHIDLKDVHHASDGDFDQRELARVYDTDNAHDLVVASHVEHAHGRPFIAFTVSVAGADDLARKFQAAGYSVVAVNGETDKSIRRAVVEMFRLGQIDGLVNCGVFTEGIDLPMLEVVHWVRPTRSDLIYMQAIGRVLRTSPGKIKALILDYVPLDTRNIMLAGDLLGKPRAQRELEAKARKEGIVIEGVSHTGPENGIDGDPDALVTRTLNYMLGTGKAWFYHGGWSTLTLGSRDKVERTLVVTNRRDGAYCLAVYARHVYTREEQVAVVTRSTSWDDITRHADELSDRIGQPTIVKRGERWRRHPANAQQVDYLRRAGLTTTGLTQGDAANLIAWHQAKTLIESTVKTT